MKSFRATYTFGMAVIPLLVTFFACGKTQGDSDQKIRLKSRTSDAISQQKIDKKAPEDAAVSMEFEDTDSKGGFLSGTVKVSRAINETSITDYYLYLASSKRSKLPNSLPIAILDKKLEALSYEIPRPIAIPAEASYILVVTANSYGEMEIGVSIPIVDKGVPKNAAVSLGFSDLDLKGGKLSGSVEIAKSSDESDITHYVLYWGSSETTKLELTPIATLEKKGSNLSYTLPAGTSKPNFASHLLVFTRNIDGELMAGVSAPIIDKGVPENPAVDVSFVDTDSIPRAITGTVNISRAYNENDVTAYVLYWGEDSKTKLADAPAIATMPKTGKHLQYVLTPGTPIPNLVKNLLVFTKNADGEMMEGWSVDLVDKSVPVNKAASVSFTDTDSIPNQVTGKVEIKKALNETDVNDYVLYWGTETKKKLETTPFATLPKNGSDPNQILTSIIKPLGATHIRVFTRNAAGEMSEGVNVSFSDKGVPTHPADSVSFIDTEIKGGKIAGEVRIIKATDETDVTDYVLYWGSSASTKLNQIATFKKGSNLSYTFGAATAILSSATHLLVFTKFNNGEMATGISVPIIDIGVPIHKAASVTFDDTDQIANELTGEVKINKATDETDVDGYVLYWGSNAATKLNPLILAKIRKDVTPLSFTLRSEGRPHLATHILVFTYNAQGEMMDGVNILISDRAVPVHAAQSVKFTAQAKSDVFSQFYHAAGFFDKGSIIAEIGSISASFITKNTYYIQGNITISKAADETDLTDYVIYAGFNGPTKQTSILSPLTTIKKTGFDLEYPASFRLPPMATHILVFTKNNVGEMMTGVSVRVRTPSNPATGVSFSPTSSRAGTIAGVVNILKAIDESDVTDYVLYWGNGTNSKMWDANTQQNLEPIATIPKTGSNLPWSLAPVTKPLGATHFLVFTKNEVGEMTDKAMYVYIP